MTNNSYCVYYMRENMTLPKAKHKKLINEKEFIKVAKEVKKSIEEEVKYIYEKKIKNGNSLSGNIHSLA